MRRLMIIANGAITIFFIGFFTYTFVGRQHVDSLAREFVTAKTQQYAHPLVVLAEQALGSKLARKLLKDEQLAVFEDEIAEYHKDPKDYIGQLTGRRAPAAMQQVTNPLVKKITGWKTNVRAYYNKVLNRLFWDLRIFAGSNLAAGLIAMGLAYRAKVKPAGKALGVSLLLSLATVFCIYMYIDSYSFFMILTDSYLGWWYPVILIVTFIGLHFDF